MLMKLIVLMVLFYNRLEVDFVSIGFAQNASLCMDAYVYAVENHFCCL